MSYACDQIANVASWGHRLNNVTSLGALATQSSNTTPVVRIHDRYLTKNIFLKEYVTNRKNQSARLKIAIVLVHNLEIFTKPRWKSVCLKVFENGAVWRSSNDRMDHVQLEKTVQRKRKEGNGRLAGGTAGGHKAIGLQRLHVLLEKTWEEREGSPD